MVSPPSGRIKMRQRADGNRRAGSPLPPSAANRAEEYQKPQPPATGCEIGKGSPSDLGRHGWTRMDGIEDSGASQTHTRTSPSPPSTPLDPVTCGHPGTPLIGAATTPVEPFPWSRPAAAQSRRACSPPRPTEECHGSSARPRSGFPQHPRLPSHRGSTLQRLSAAMRQRRKPHHSMTASADRPPTASTPADVFDPPDARCRSYSRPDEPTGCRSDPA